MHVVKVYSKLTGEPVGFASHPGSTHLSPTTETARKFATAADAMVFAEHAFPRQWPHHHAMPAIVPTPDEDDALGRLVDIQGNAADRTPVRLA